MSTTVKSGLIGRGVCVQARILRALHAARERVLARTRHQIYTFEYQTKLFVLFGGACVRARVRVLCTPRPTKPGKPWPSIPLDVCTGPMDCLDHRMDTIQANKDIARFNCVYKLRLHLAY